ncbi:MAG: flagellar basal body P-ring protein FlgI [Fuerstiella sp.]|nr:flagellar basal body P-ring protein FlgI [Fuerstiella sp.]
MNADPDFQHDARHIVFLLLGAIVFICCGCTSSLLQLPSNGITSRFTEFVRGDSVDKDTVKTSVSDDFDTSLKTPLLGDYTSVQGNTLVPLRGIGLVVNLDGTGGDPPPSSLRSTLQREMARRKIPSPSKILGSPNTAMVVVTAYLPAFVRKGQPFDVRVLLPANTKASSLKGGYLLATRLFEETEVRGHGTHRGDEYAIAEGPVLTAFGASEGSAETKGLMGRGSIPGGAIATTNRELDIVIRRRFQSIRKSKQIADAVSARFQRYDRFGRQQPLAVAKTDALIKLHPHPVYRNNFPRFHHVIRCIPVAENEVARRLRLEGLSERLLIPESSALAAVQLEAVGNDAKAFLHMGLKSSYDDVRFFAAEALAYLQDSQESEAVEILKAAARDEPAFRVYALAALSTMDTAQSMLALRELLSTKSLEARYGAVRAISEMNDNDRSLNTMRFKNRFILRQIDSNGTPAVHLARRRSPEIVVFGTNQKLLLPAVLNVGNRIRVIGHDGDETVEISRYQLGQETVRRTCSRRLVDILKAVGEMKAAYPDVVQFMIEAEQQDNLAGELGIDRLPQGGRTYIQKMSGDELETGRKVGTPSRTPGIFDRIEDVPTDGEDRDLNLTTFSNPSQDSNGAASGTSGEPSMEPTDQSESDILNASSQLDSTVESDVEPDSEEFFGNQRSSAGILNRLMRNPFSQYEF